MKKFEILGKNLSKEEQKNVLGGYQEPIGDAGGYKCCWDDQPSNCSDCVPAAEPKCVKGASAVSC